jgi:hypothetical protein
MDFYIFIYCVMFSGLFYVNILDYIDYKSKGYSDPAWRLEVKKSARATILSFVWPIYCLIYIIKLIKDAI